MKKYGESKTTQIMMATVRHVTSSSGLLDRWIFVRLSVQTHVISVSETLTLD